MANYCEFLRNIHTSDIKPEYLEQLRPYFLYCVNNPGADIDDIEFLDMEIIMEQKDKNIKFPDDFETLICNMLCFYTGHWIKTEVLENLEVLVANILVSSNPNMDHIQLDDYIIDTENYEIDNSPLSKWARDFFK